MTIEDLLNRFRDLGVLPEDYPRYELRLVADGDWFGYHGLEVERVAGVNKVCLSCPELDAVVKAPDDPPTPVKEALQHYLRREAEA